MEEATRDSVIRKLFIALALIGAIVWYGERPLPSATRTSLVTRGLDDLTAQRIADSLYWHLGSRPDTIALERGILHLGFPAVAFGQAVVFEDEACHRSGPAEGAQILAARLARRFAGIHAPDTVIITVGQLTARRGNWLHSEACGIGPSMTRFGLEDLERPYGLQVPPNELLHLQARPAS